MNRRVTLIEQVPTLSPVLFFLFKLHIVRWVQLLSSFILCMYIQLIAFNIRLVLSLYTFFFCFMAMIIDLLYWTKPRNRNSFIVYFRLTIQKLVKKDLERKKNNNNNEHRKLLNEWIITYVENYLKKNKLKLISYC